MTEFNELQGAINSSETAYQNYCAAPQNGTYYLLNVGAGKCLDVQGKRTGDGVVVFAWYLNSPPTLNQQAS